MTNLVHRLLLLSRQLPILVDSLFLKEVPDLVARVQEVVVANVIIVASSELGLNQNPQRVNGISLNDEDERTRGWASRLKLLKSCVARVSNASVSSLLRKFDRRKYLVH